MALTHFLRQAPGLGLIIFVLCLYSPSFFHADIWDDHIFTYGLLEFASLEGLYRIWFEPAATIQYYPLTFTSLWIEHQFLGVNLFCSHFVNVLLHALSAMILWKILKLLELPGAWVAAGIFACHPIYTESISWIAERKNTLSGFFYFLAAFIYFKYVFVSNREKKSQLFFAFLLFLAAVLSKTVTCTLPAAALLIVWWKEGQIKLSDIKDLMPFFICGVFLGLMTVNIEKSDHAFGPYWDFTLLERFMIAGRALCFYFVKILFPYNLAFIYPSWNVHEAYLWQYTFLFVALIIIFSLWIFRKEIGRGPVTAVLYFAGTLFPALGFFDVFPFQYSFVADHFQYLGSVGIVCLMVSIGLNFVNRISSGQFVQRGMVLVILSALSIQTWFQQSQYKDMETLWWATIEKNPKAWMAHHNLALLMRYSDRQKQAVHHFYEALKLRPDKEEIQMSLAGLLSSLGHMGQAKNHYKRILEVNPRSTGACLNLGNIYAHEKKFDQAIEQFRLILKMKPRHVKAHYNLGVSFLSQSQITLAMKHFLKVVELKPDSKEATQARSHLDRIRKGS